MTSGFRVRLFTSCLALAGCGASPDEASIAANQQAVTSTPSADSPAGQPPAAATAAPAPTPEASATPVAAGMSRPRSCAAEIGAAAAKQRAAVCRNVSGATRPPCNIANSCAMIEDHIAYNCALSDGKGLPADACRPAPKSMEAAAAVVKLYYRAINARDYSTAWLQWGYDGPPNQTHAQFDQGFAHTRSTRVTIGRLTPGDAGAGSVYQTVPVTVEATLDNGTHQRFVGDYVLRRVNGVEGARPDQLRWHIDQAHLKRAGG